VTVIFECENAQKWSVGKIIYFDDILINCNKNIYILNSKEITTLLEENFKLLNCS
jgi:hypothetical protein